MALTPAAYCAIQGERKASRAAVARNIRAAGGPIYRPVPANVTIIKTVD